MKYQFEWWVKIDSCFICPMCNTHIKKKPYEELYYCNTDYNTQLLARGTDIAYIKIPNWCPLVEVQDE